MKKLTCFTRLFQSAALTFLFPAFLFAGPGNTNTVCAVQLTSFTAKQSGNAIGITWTTASETNCDHFILFHSSDGVTFEKVGEVTGAGNSSMPHDYQLQDMNASPGTNYYRLSEVDFIGMIDENVVTVTDYTAINTSVSVFPNPVSGNELHLLFPAGNAHLAIRDASGVLMMQKDVTSENGEACTVSLTGCDRKSHELLYVTVYNDTFYQTTCVMTE